MLVLLLAMLAWTSSAETHTDAATLLREVAEAAKGAQSWHIEGSIEESGTHRQPASFTLVMRSNNQTRFEQIGGSTPVTIVCGSGGTWIYSPPLNRYRTLGSQGDPVCSQVVGDWKSMPVGLKSPSAAGHKVIELGNQVVDCKLVRGYSEPELPSAGRVKRTLCIDVSRHLIVWERAETKYGSRTYTYSRIERNADVRADAFIFNPPPQSRQTPYELPVPRPLGSRSMPSDSGLSLPKLVFRKDPVYDEDSRKARIEGTVILYVVIDPRGIASEVEVFRPLSPKLDQAAVESVRQWHFAAGTKGRQPVAVATLIEVNFKLL
jgi:TonB family protein